MPNTPEQANIDLYELIIAENLEQGKKLNKIKELLAANPGIDLDRKFPGWECDQHIGATALHVAAFQGEVDIINLLVAHGAKIDIRDQGYEVPLHYAARNRQEKAVKALVTLGANVNAYGSDDDPDDESASSVDSDAYDQRANSVLWCVLYECSESDNAEFKEIYHSIVNFLILCGADVSVWGRSEEDDDYISFAIQHAADAGFCDTVEEMLNRGASVDADPHIAPDAPDASYPRRAWFNHTTPLGYALKNKNIPLIELLLKRGADTEREYDYYSTLYEEAKENNPEVLEAFDLARQRAFEQDIMGKAQEIGNNLGD